MKMIYIPTRCSKCENKVFIEKLENQTGNAYCQYCDFILPITKEELEYTEEYLIIKTGWSTRKKMLMKKSTSFSKYIEIL